MAKTVLQVSYSRKLKRVSLQRALVSLIVHYPEAATLTDLLALVDNLIWLQDKAKKDPVFQNKFGVTLEVLTYIVKSKLGKQSFTSVSVTRMKYLSNVLKSNLEGFYYPRRNTLNQYRLCKGLFNVRAAAPQGRLVSQLPPQAYIGKGYRDKGTAKIPAEDGSPSWQEVAAMPFGRISK
jgi:hypothetical protein